MSHFAIFCITYLQKTTYFFIDLYYYANRSIILVSALLISRTTWNLDNKKGGKNYDVSEGNRLQVA